MNVDEFKKIYEGNTIIVFDTNILLGLAKYSTYTSSNVLKILECCFEKIWIPYQVHREYTNNKYSVFAKSKRKYDTFKKELGKIINETNQNFHISIKESRKLEYPSCDRLEAELNKQVDIIREIIKDYYEDLGSEHYYLKKDKQIKDLECFIEKLIENRKIGDQPTNSEMLSILSEGELRYKYKIPPGYMDFTEKVGIEAFGDLFIWKEILKYPIDNKISNIIFVTNDIKEDWWVIKGETPIGIRPELEKEFKEFNPECDVIFLDLSMFHGLTSTYFNIPSYHTFLELSAYTYCKTKLLPKFEDRITDELNDYVYGLDVTDFSDEFYRCNDNEILYEKDLEFVSCDFQIDSNLALYTMHLTLPFIIYMNYEDIEGTSFRMGNVTFTLDANVEISQEILIDELRLEDTNSYNVTYIKQKNVDVTDPYDYYGGDDECDDADETTEAGEG